MNFLEKCTGPKGRNLSLYFAELIIYFGVTALVINPSWCTLGNQIIFFLVFLISLLPYLFYAVRELPKSNTGFKLSVLLVGALVVSQLVTAVFSLVSSSDFQKLIAVTIAYAITSSLARWCRKKLPGVS